LQELAVECGGLCARGTVILELSELQAFAEAVASDVKAENEALKHLLVDASQYVRNEYNEHFKMYSDYPHWANELKEEKDFLDAIEKAIKLSEPPPPIQLEDFTLPPIHLPSIGKAK